jgi:ABC-type glycerol-3-phosphate transport system substrate-binding protein
LDILKKRSWKRFRKQDLPQTFFLAITLVSAGLLILPLWNYTKYYNAITDFGYTIPTVALDTSQLKTANLTVVNIPMRITNPTSYSGLTVTDVTCTLQWIGPEHEIYVQQGSSQFSPWAWVNTTLWNLPPGRVTGEFQVPPNSNTTITIRISITPNTSNQNDQQNAYDFIDYLETSPGQIQWYLSCTLGLESFMSGFQIYNQFTPVTQLS